MTIWAYLATLGPVLFDLAKRLIAQIPGKSYKEQEKDIYDARPKA